MLLLLVPFLSFLVISGESDLMVEPRRKQQQQQMPFGVITAEIKIFFVNFLRKFSLAFCLTPFFSLFYCETTSTNDKQLLL